MKIHVTNSRSVTAKGEISFFCLLFCYLFVFFVSFCFVLVSTNSLLEVGS